MCPGTCFVIPEIGVSNGVTGPEHAGDAETLPQPSYCTLPMFHPQSDPSVVPALGYISNDGHHFSCRNPGTPLASLFGSNSGPKTPFLCTNELVLETLLLDDGSTQFLV